MSTECTCGAEPILPSLCECCRNVSRDREKIADLESQLAESREALRLDREASKTMHRRAQKAESEALRWKDACLERRGAPLPPSITGEIAAARLARSKALRDTIPSPPPFVPFRYEVQLPSAGGWAVRYLARTQDEAWEHAQPGDRVMRK